MYSENICSNMQNFTNCRLGSLLFLEKELQRIQSGQLTEEVDAELCEYLVNINSTPGIFTIFSCVGHPIFNKKGKLKQIVHGYLWFSVIEKYQQNLFLLLQDLYKKEVLASFAFCKNVEIHVSPIEILNMKIVDTFEIYPTIKYSTTLGDISHLTNIMDLVVSSIKEDRL